MNIGQRVREVREGLGMQATVLARRVGVAPNTIYRIETGDRTPSVALLEKIARELRTEPAELFKEPVPLAEAAGRDLPNSIEELLERRHTSTRHLADPLLVINLAVSPIEDVLEIVREVSEELEAIGPDVTRFAQLRDNPEAMRLFSEVSRQAWTTHLALPARRGQKFVQVLPAPVSQLPPEIEISPELESEINEAIRTFEEARRPLLAEVGV
jgi:transcriptional regulator with XRE-family HTH domain